MMNYIIPILKKKLKKKKINDFFYINIFFDKDLYSLNFSYFIFIYPILYIKKESIIQNHY